MQEQIKRLKQWKNGKMSGPFGIELSPTLKCNLMCSFCWRKVTDVIDYNNELNFEDYRRIIEQASKLNVREIKIIGGGEAFARKDILDLMSLVKEKDIFGYVCTNGTLFNEENIKKIVRINWDYIKISLHGPEEVHNSLVGDKGAFKKIICALKIFRKYMLQYNKKVPYIEFGVVLVNKNYDKIDQIIKIATKNNINAVFLEPITVYSNYGRKLKLSKEQQDEFRVLIKKYLSLGKKYNVTNNFDSFFNNALIEKTNKMDEIILKDRSKNDFINLPCFEPWLRMGIRADGLVGPCGFFDEYSKENAKTKNLKDIWFGDYFKRIRENMLKRNLPEHCKKCCTTLVANNQRIREGLIK